ncbi:MAG: hypothetical protein M3O02_11275 [Acidobacteriota bacterium]|nr:hypothetical protein [Acidobacteriota bacterium]
MSARGFNIAQEGHTVLVLNPGSISGGVVGQVFSLKNAAKANIIIQWGALAAAQGQVQLFACSDLAGDNPVAIGFDRFQQVASGAGNDVLAARVAVPAAGYLPSDVPNTIDVLVIQADTLPTGTSYLKLAIADGTNVDYAAAVAILTGLSFQGDSNPSATV